MGEQTVLHGRCGHDGRQQQQPGVDDTVAQRTRSAADETDDERHRTDDRGQKAEQHGVAPDGGVHRALPSGAVTRPGC